LEQYKEARYPESIVATEENEGRVDQGGEKGPYDDEVAVWDLPLQDASTISECEPVIDGSEASPGEQHMGEHGHDKQKSDRDKNVSIR
jgi:hypothetical protein